jgi:F-type H+-transporting ATPase subunit gamma
MASTITLKHRITSVKNTKQITKAMELVSASKMRRAQEHALHSRPYREYAYSLLSRLNTITEVNEHPLFVVRNIKTRLYIVITSNSGLAGAYNSNILRLLTHAILEDKNAGVNIKIIAIGKKASQYVRRLELVELIAAYTEFDDNPTSNDVRPLLNTIIDLYKSKNVDDVRLMYTEFKSNIVQIAKNMSLLPARLDVDSDQSILDNVTFEPSINAVLDSVTARLLEIQIWQSLLESIASEHSMRMLAMKNATDNATDLIDDLTLAFNTARQSAITQELAEITGGAEAMK